MLVGEDLHLTYCTNIHPSSGWEEVRSSVLEYGADLKYRLSPDADFGIGLRLSGAESSEFLIDERLGQFRKALDESGLYVFTMNAFPHGTFHNSRVKDHVHTPDWREQERVDYTKRCIDILAHLLPEGMEGGISTNPLSYQPWFGESIDDNTWSLFVDNLVEVVSHLARLEDERGIFIHIDIEPEPDGVFDNSRDLVRFYKDHLLTSGSERLGSQLSISKEKAEGLLLRHLQVCWDTCHLAVAYEKADSVLDSYKSLGIQVGKIQISSALRVDLPASLDQRSELKKSLQDFAESTYLHQVVQRNQNNSFVSYPDLDLALEQIQDEEAEEWRIHFHVPIFTESLNQFGSTQSEITEALGLNKRSPFTRHLEIETYTWDVLPPFLKIPMADSIHREYQWVLKTIHGDGIS